MATSSSADSAGRSPVFLAIAGVLGVLVIVAAVATTLVASKGDDRRQPDRFRPADRSFTVAVPAGWRALDAERLRRIPSAPAAVLRRQDRRGLVVIRRRPALERSRRALTGELTRELRRRFRGMQPVAARTVRLRSGAAYVYTFARPRAGTVQSIAVAPLADRTYTLDAVTGAGAGDVASQIGAIVRSFDASTSNPLPRP